MAYTTPPTFVTGNVLTAAQMNTNVRDNPNFLHDPPGCQISRTTNQTIGTSTTPAPLTLGTVIYDTDSMTGTANRIITTTAGIYSFSAELEWGIQSGGSRVAIISDVLGVTTTQAISFVSPAGTAAANSCSGDFKCTASQSFFLQVWQNSGSSVSVLGTSSASNVNPGPNAGLAFSAHWVGAG